MESKKVNIFAFIMIVVMCAFSIFMGVRNGTGEDGIDGKSSYELAVEKGLFTGTELEYLQSLQGKDGSSVTIEDVYNAYLSANDLTSDECSLADFIDAYYPHSLLDEATEKALSEFATAQALRSTVDIVYSFYLDESIISVTPSTLTQTNESIYLLSETNSAPIGVSAGSGIIYQVNEDTAYIITNYHVVYVDNYSNDSNYKVYYNESTGEYFTAKHSEDDEFTVSSGGGFFGYTQQYTAVKTVDVEKAPTSTHFLNEYEVYLYGYQAEGYALSATFVGGSADNDIAVLKINKNSSNKNNERIFTQDYKAVTLGDSTKLAVGENAIAVGNPLIPDTSNVDTSTITTISDYVNAYKKSYVSSLCLTATDGVVSNISEYQSFESLLDGSAVSMRLIRVSSAINAGNSGGGLYDIEGNLIGIVNGKIASSDYDNVGYAIPVNVAVNLADRIISECEGISGEVNIKAVTAENLGLKLKTSKSGTKSPYYDEEKLEWVNVNSVVVDGVTALKLASSVGIKEGDIINSIEINSKIYELNNDYDFNDIMLKLSYPESTTTIKLSVITQDEYGALATKTIELNLDSSYFTLIK